jgi:gluconate 2-dehydrogenase gamma chain
MKPETKNPAALSGLSRRSFLKGAGVILATGAGMVLANCQPRGQAVPAPTPVRTLNDKYLHVPPAPPVAPEPGLLQFFTPEEARTLDAFVARLLPGTPDDPGAREAGVVTFIDNMLATHPGYAEPTYTRGPFARFHPGDAPPAEAAGADPSEVIWVPEEWKSNFGWQLGQPPQELYRAGIAALDQMAGGSFADLSEAEQDALIGPLADEAAGNVEPGGQGGPPGEGGGFESGIEGFSGGGFFDMIKQHTIHGMFGDPLYGGNRGLAGWRLIGYPGARRAYTPRDLLSEDTPLEAQSLAHLRPFHPGQPVSDDVIIPLANGRSFDHIVETGGHAESCQLQPE